MTRLLLTLVAVLMPLAAAAQPYPDAQRIVSIGGPVTELIFLLGAADRVIARDTTSSYPEEVNDLPDVGYMRQLSAEGVLSVGPDLIVTRDTAGPVEAMDQLRAAAIPMVEVHDGYSADSVVAAMRTVGVALGLPERGEALARQAEADFAALKAKAAAGPAVRVMFVLSNQGGRLNVAGAGTGADGILSLSGAENVMAAEFQGYKIVSDEAIIAAAPQVILMMEPTGNPETDDLRAGVMDLPAVKQTPAGAAEALVRVPPAALGFGPRTAALAGALHDTLANAVK
ncbi:hemin ABC transporter substrate-binding protein [Primorskyibacter flagellatus]|uniref:Hemin ABC transporter substrate-binding protein n=1 Tax=Primorskyibacter flagellatus TaxID=1387277 RepID=A0A916ZVW4_9RHOB|nr:ABC transporter substrate-binding protein [Primorskyibacter flagellatus]GGE16419.1 hemin ABC transporter substrate-binding protein [Primorskyibacter flagellatus]